VFETVVVGTDGSATAEVALKQAAELAKAGGAALHVVTAFRPSSKRTFTAGGEKWQLLPADRADAVLDEAVALGRMLGVKVEVHGRRGDPANAIVRVAKEVGADVVVVGNKGMKGAKRFLLGSVPNKVAHSAPCAVLIIKTT
jgi:nucleotide-binding universal stress UspA family protein